MGRRSCRLTAGHAAVVLAVLTGCATGSSAAASPTLSSRIPASGGATPITAVATLAGEVAVGGSGVQVVAHLRGIGSELVRGTPAALAQLARHPQVTGVRPDGPVTTSNASDTTLNAAGPGVFGWQQLGGRAGQPGAGAGVTVAVVDTGISDMPALNRSTGRLVDGVDTSGLVTGGEVRTDGAFPDGYGHGTFLANLIAGGPSNGSGSPNGSTAETGPPVGVAPAARVVSVKVADDSGETSLAAVLAGLDWVATHRPMDVVALALAADRPTGAYGADPLTAAVTHLREAGLSVIASAGNTAGEVADPGFDPGAVTVGAADTTANVTAVADFSGSGMVHGVRKPDLVAPGVRVLSLLPAESGLARSNPQARVEGDLWRGSGTSPATALAAGVAAIHLADHPDAGPAAVKSMLRGAARPMAQWRAGAGLLAVPGAADTPDFRGGTLDKAAWSAGQWDVPGWAENLDESWTTGVWSAKSWSSNPWSANPWSAKSWSAKSWSAKSWSAKSWSAKSWSAKSWSAKSWSTYGWVTDPGTR